MDDIRVLAVTGYFRTGARNFDFGEDESWKGFILLKPNNTFAGVVVDNSPKNFDRLIVGAFPENSICFFLKIANHGLCTCSFNGMANGKEIIGTWGIYDLQYRQLQFSDIGRFKLTFATTEKSNAEIAKISERIEAVKKDMDSTSTSLYNNSTSDMGSDSTVMMSYFRTHQTEWEQDLRCHFAPLNI